MNDKEEKAWCFFSFLKATDERKGGGRERERDVCIDGLCWRLSAGRPVGIVWLYSRCFLAVLRQGHNPTWCTRANRAGQGFIYIYISVD